MYGTKPNDLSQFDYMNLWPSNSGDKYILMLCGDHLNYKWFFCFPNTDAENAAHAITDWCATNSVPGRLMSGGPTHFKNDTANLVPKGLNTPIHFALPSVRGTSVLWNAQHENFIDPTVA